MESTLDQSSIHTSGSCITEMNSNKTTSEPESQPIKQDDNVEENGTFDGFVTDLFVAVPSLPTDHRQQATAKLRNTVKPLLENYIENRVRFNEQEKKIQKLEMKAQKRIKRCMRIENRNQKLEMENKKLIEKYKRQIIKIEKLIEYIRFMDTRAKMTSNKNMEDKKPTQEERKNTENVEEENTDGPGNPTGYVKPKVGNVDNKNEETGDADCQNSGKDILGNEKRPLALPSVYTTDAVPPFAPNVNSCPCSCGLYAFLCMLRTNYGHEYCSSKFFQMVSNEETLKPSRCSDFLEHMRTRGYVKKVFRCKDVDADGGLDKVLMNGLGKLKRFFLEETCIPEESSHWKPLRKRPPCGILSYKTDLYSHAVMITSFDDINSPEVKMEIYDPQKHKWFPNSEPHLDRILYVEMIVITEDEDGPLIREWLNHCGVKICEEEFKALRNTSTSCFDTSTSAT